MRRAIVIAVRAGVKDRDGCLLTKQNIKTLVHLICLQQWLNNEVALKQKMCRRSLKRSAE